MNKSDTNEKTDTFSEAIVETTRESILGLDRDLRINFANKSFYTTFKVTPKETVGKLIYELGNGQWNIPKLKTLLEDILPKENTFENFEILHNFPDLGQKTMILNARKLHRKPGEEPTILLVIEDITERKELENKLAVYTSGLEKEVTERTESIAIEKARDEAILQSIGDGLIVVDQDGKIVYVNKAFESLLGWKKEEVVGKLMVEVVPREDDAGKVVPFKERILSIILSDKNSTTTTTTTTTYYYIRKDGSRFPVASIITPISLDQKIIGAVETFRDITKESTVDKAKTEFVSLASHQLLTPASTISWYTEMLLSGDVGKITETQKKYLDEIYHGNQRMVKLISSLLNVSRLELGTFMVSPEPTDITKLAQSVIDEQKPQIEERKITITAKFERGIPRLSVDPNLIRIVFQNLLSNAVKYTPEGGKVTMEIALQEGKIQIKVSDTGFGIPSNQQNQMFTKLFRADNVREKDIEGTGLGLYIVKSIIENSTGKIWFESHTREESLPAGRQGTTFYVELPLEGMKRKVGTKSLS